MANTGNRLKPEEIREVAFGDITASFVQMGATFSGPLRTFYIENATDAIMEFSIDGTKVNWKLRPGAFRLYDLKTNDTFLNTGQAVYVRYAAVPSEGYVICEAATA